MRLKPSSHQAKVGGNDNPRRPVTLTVAGLTFTLSASAARVIADELHDAADRAGTRSVS